MKTPFKSDFVRSQVNLHGPGKVYKNSDSRTIKVIKRKKAEEY